MNVGNKEINGPWTPKIFANIHKSHYLNFAHLNTFFREGFRQFHQTLKGVLDTRRVKNSCAGPLFLSVWFEVTDGQPDDWSHYYYL